MIVVAREIAYRPWKNLHHPLHKTLYGVCRIETGSMKSMRLGGLIDVA
jgi:hypothetical protein